MNYDSKDSALLVASKLACISVVCSVRPVIKISFIVVA